MNLIRKQYGSIWLKYDMKNYTDRGGGEYYLITNILSTRTLWRLSVAIVTRCDVISVIGSTILALLVSLVQKIILEKRFKAVKCYHIFFTSSMQKF